MTLAERYMNDKPIGTASDSAFSGILLFQLHKEDSYEHHNYVVANVINGKRMDFRRQIVEYEGDRPYVFKRGRKWYLDEIMRTE